MPTLQVDEHGNLIGGNTKRVRPTPSASELAGADARAAICDRCDETQGITRERNGFPVHTVKCKACGCGGLSLVHGSCPKGLWPTVEGEPTDDQPHRPDYREAVKAEIKARVCDGCGACGGVKRIVDGSPVYTVTCGDAKATISLVTASCPRRAWPDLSDDNKAADVLGLRMPAYRKLQREMMERLNPTPSAMNPSLVNVRHRKSPKRAPEVAAKAYGDSGGEPERIILRNRQSPGDILMLTALVRDLHKAHPGRYKIDVDTPCPALWEHNPHVEHVGGEGRTISLDYPLIHQSNQRPVHFLQGFHDDFERKTGVHVPVTAYRGDIHLSEAEKGWTNQVAEHHGHDGPFWIMMGGGKWDFTAKWWPTAFYQQVVDHFRGRIRFVQCGSNEHFHQPLEGVINLVGQTDLRQMVRLMYHADGVVCPVTFAMHLAAAVPTKHNRLRPAVVIGGGREPTHWEAYPGHQHLHTIGQLDCCALGGCWKSRCQTVGDGDPKDRPEALCPRPVMMPADVTIRGKRLTEVAYPECMTMITPEMAINAIEGWYRGGVLTYLEGGRRA